MSRSNDTFARIAGAVAIALVAACGGSESSATRATPWPAGDKLFHADARWLGGDAAYSTDLGDGRILWLFGDSFVATTSAHLRSQAKMPHNTVGIQTGKDAATASMKFFWRESDGMPSSFFADEASAVWFWPGPAVKVGSRLVVTLSRVGASSGGLGFTTLGSRAVSSTATTGDPSTWPFANIDLPTIKFGALLSTGSWMVDGSFVYAYAAREPGNHDLFVARYPISDLESGNLQHPSWWSKGTWVSHDELQSEPDVVMSNGQTELSVSRDEERHRYLEIQVDGFGGTNIAMRTSPRPEGPWSNLVPVYRPPESNRPNVLVYSAKAHPELASPDLLVTYASNSTDFATLVSDTSLYFPKFVRLSF